MLFPVLKATIICHFYTLLFEWDIKNSASHLPGSETTQLEGRERKCSGCSQRKRARSCYQSYQCKSRVKLLAVLMGSLEQYRTMRIDPLGNNKTQKKRREKIGMKRRWAAPEWSLVTGLLGQKEVSAFRALLAAYISLQQTEQSITVFNQVWPFPHSVTPAPQITSRRCFYSRSTGAVRYLQPPQSLATGTPVPGEKPAQQVHKRPCYALVLWSLSGTSFRPVDAADVVCNKPTVYRNVDSYHNYLLFFLC